MASILFYRVDGKPISAEQFLHNLYGKLPELFKDEDELRKIWSIPATCKTLLEKLAEAGFAKDELSAMQSLVNAEKSDLFDVFEYISFVVQPISREARMARAQSSIFESLNPQQKEFLEFVLAKYIEIGVEELDQEKLSQLLTLQYRAINDAKEILGNVDAIRELFLGFQKYLYARMRMSTSAMG